MQIIFLINFMQTRQQPVGNWFSRNTIGVVFFNYLVSLVVFLR